MEEFQSWQRSVATEDVGSARVDRTLLEEAAQIGRALVEKNEELQRENELLRSAQRRFSVLSAASEPSEDRTSPDHDATSRLLRSRASQGSEQRSQRHSLNDDVAVLAKEYDTDMETVLQENGRLRENSLQLERDNRELAAKVQELTGASRDEFWQDDEASWREAKTDRRRSGSRRMSSCSGRAPQDHDDLASELDNERARNWDFRQQLEAAKRETAKQSEEVAELTAAYLEQQQELDAKDRELAALRNQFLEVTDLMQQQWLAGNVDALVPKGAAAGRAHVRGGDRHESLANDLRTAFTSFADEVRPERPLRDPGVEAEIAQLRQKVEAAERAAKEAQDASSRHRELARRVKQAAQKDAQDLRKRLATAEGGGLKGQGSLNVQALLENNEKLRRSLQAETKARVFIEAELMRTLTGIRKMDLEMY